MKTKTPGNLKSPSQKASSSPLALRAWMLVPAASVIMPFSGHAGLLSWDNFLTDGYLNGSQSAQSVSGGPGETGAQTWAHYSGTTADQIPVSAGLVTLTDSLSEDASLAFNGNVSVSTDVYVGMTINIPTPVSTVGTDFEYFAGFKPASNFTIKSRVDIAFWGSVGFKPGISAGSSVAEATWADDLAYGNDHRMIVRYNATSGEAQLWMNPANAASTSIFPATMSTSDPITEFFYRQGSATPDFTLTSSGFVTGTTFEDVLNPVVSVPEPTADLLAGLAGLMLLRRKRNGVRVRSNIGSHSGAQGAQAFLV